MKVINRINNNVVLVKKDNKKMIVTGKGLGFKVIPNDIVNERMVEQTFILQENYSDDYYSTLLKEIPFEILEVSKEIVELASRELQKEFSTNLIFTLADHITFAISRMDQQMAIDHPLALEIKNFYALEMEVGKKAVDLIEKKLGVVMVNGEILFITMHLVNASGGLTSSYDVAELTDIMVHILGIIEHLFSITIDQETVTFSRFITHLRYYLIRQLHFEIDNSINDELLELVQEKYPKAYACANTVTDYLDTRYNTKSVDSEKLYLTLHINRLLNTN